MTRFGGEEFQWLRRTTGDTVGRYPLISETVPVRSRSFEGSLAFLWLKCRS